MDRLLVTRPRWGSRTPLRGVRRRRRERVDPESAPRLEPMSRGRGHKGLSEYFSPLVRFLRSRVGEPWDEVYSEIRRCIPNDSTVKAHVYVHLEEFVLRDVFLEEGRPVVVRWGAKRSLAELRAWRDEFYVCPTTGRLCELPRARRRTGKVELGEARIVSAEVQLHCLAGLWYEVRLADVPVDAAERRRAFDRVLRRNLCDLDAERLYLTYGAATRFAAERRSLSRREIRDAQRLPRVCAVRDRYDRWDIR